MLRPWDLLYNNNRQRYTDMLLADRYNVPVMRISNVIKEKTTGFELLLFMYCVDFQVFYFPQAGPSGMDSRHVADLHRQKAQALKITSV